MIRDNNPAKVRVTAFLVFLSMCILLFSCTPPASRRGGGRVIYGSGEDIVHTARRYLGVPYVNGGSTPEGFDCSGYVMYVYGKNGIRLPRSANEQYRGGRPISVRQAGPGDLLFFRTRGSRVSHVAIHTGGGHFIHAPSEGKSISFSSLENSYWNRRFVGAVTYFREGPRPSQASRPSRREWVH